MKLKLKACAYVWLKVSVAMQKPEPGLWCREHPKYPGYWRDPFLLGIRELHAKGLFLSIQQRNAISHLKQLRCFQSFIFFCLRGEKHHIFCIRKKNGNSWTKILNAFIWTPRPGLAQSIPEMEFLEVFKARGEEQSGLVEGITAHGRVWDWMGLKIPPNPNHCGIL